MPSWGFERNEFNEEGYRKLLRQLEWILNYLDGDNIAALPSTLITGVIPSSDVSVDDTGGYYISNNVEGVLQQIGSTILNIPTSDVNLSVDTPVSCNMIAATIKTIQKGLSDPESVLCDIRAARYRKPIPIHIILYGHFAQIRLVSQLGHGDTLRTMPSTVANLHFCSHVIHLLQLEQCMIKPHE